MCSDLKGLSQFCAIYSTVGALFMLMVTMMLTYQPFYMGGIEDVDDSKSAAKGALGTFIFTFGASIFYLIYDCVTGDDDNYDMPPMNHQRQRYEGVPTQNNGPEGILNNYALSLELPPSVEQGVFTNSS